MTHPTPRPRRPVPTFSSPEERRVAPGIYQIPLPVPYPFGYVNTYLLRGPDSVALLDCGIDYPDTVQVLRSSLLEFGLGFGDLDALLISHHHPDHYGNAGLLEGHGVTVYLPSLERKRGLAFFDDVETGLIGFAAWFERHGMPPEVQQANLADIRENRAHMHLPQRPVWLEPDTLLEVAGMRLRPLWTPGHADEHLAFLREEDGTLLAGDFLLERITPIIGKWNYSRPNPLQDYLDALERVRGLGARLALTGHYGPGIDPELRITQMQEHHRERLEATLEAVRQGGDSSGWELSLALFPAAGLDAKQRRFAWAETLAHLELLRVRGQVDTLERAGEVLGWTVR